MKKIRILLSLFIASLVLSGITAFPLLTEVTLLARLLDSISWVPDVLRTFIHGVHHGLADTYSKYPFMPYGTDWLGFGHFAIAIFFIGPLRDPIRNIWVIHAGMIACVAVFPVAFICGALRQVPFYWQLIDCSFGVGGFLVLWYILKLIRDLEKAPKPLR